VIPGRGEPARPATREWLALVAILALAVGLRLYHVTVPLVDTSDWRQTDTAAIAYFYYHLGIRLLHPQLWHDGPGPDYTQLELQLTPALDAILAHVFGYGHTLLRVTVLCLFTLATVPFWALVRRHFGPGVALWASLVYVLLPVGIFFGRAYQPENMQLLTGMAGLWAADRYGQRRTVGRYVLAALVLAVAVCAKLTSLMLLVPAAALAYQEDLWRFPAMFSWRRLLPVAGLVIFAAGAGAAYTIGQAAVAVTGTRYVNFIVSSLGNAYIAGTTGLWPFFWQQVLGMAITPAGLLAGVIGVFALRGRRSAGWVWVWAAAIALYALVVLRAIRFQYYLMPLLPFFALLAGAGLQSLTADLPARLRARLPGAAAVLAGGLPQLAAVALVASMLTGGLFQIQGFWVPYMPWYTGGVALDHYLPPDAVVILSGTYNPTLLYYARRHGYRIDPLTMSALEADVAGGARYLIDQGGIDPCMASYIADNFPAVGVGGITVYQLPAVLPAPGGDLYGNCLQ